MPGRRLTALAAGIAAVLVLLGLGVWQVERLQWKHALIAQVERRLAAAPVAAPGPAGWSAIGKDDAYTRVRVAGRWIGPDTLVQAVTDLGGGYWVLTPLETRQGWTVLVNRGFVPPAASSRLRKEGGDVPVTGLLRVTEPGGAFLRHNDPAANRWYSRDVAAIATAQGIVDAAPYFIDADHSGASDSGEWPRGGMTVVRFPNNHLVYALTWFGLAGLVAFLLWRVARR